MTLAEVTVTVTQLQSEIATIQGKLERLASSTRRNLTQTAATLHKVADCLKDATRNQSTQAEPPSALATIELFKRQNKPDPLALGDICIQYRAIGWSDVKIASYTGYTSRYIQKVARVASSSAIRPYVESGCVASDIADRLMQRYHICLVLRILEKAMNRPSLRKGRKITQKSVDDIIKSHQF